MCKPTPDLTDAQIDAVRGLENLLRDASNATELLARRLREAADLIPAVFGLSPGPAAEVPPYEDEAPPGGNACPWCHGDSEWGKVCLTCRDARRQAIARAERIGAMTPGTTAAFDAAVIREFKAVHSTPRTDDAALTNEAFEVLRAMINTSFSESLTLEYQVARKAALALFRKRHGNDHRKTPGTLG
jgi:hypothetical protein